MRIPTQIVTFLSLLALAHLCQPLSADEAQARDLLAKIGAGRGICLLVGDAGNLATDLARQSQWTFFVQQPKAQADKLRVPLDQAGLLGNRVYVHDGVDRSLYLANDLADVVVVSASIALPEKEILRVLRPEGKALVGDKTLTKPFASGSDEWSHPYFIGGQDGIVRSLELASGRLAWSS